MKRLIAVLVVALLIAMTGVAGADHPPAHHPIPRTCTAQAFRGFSKTIWDPAKWKRGNPPQNVLEAVRKRESCAPPGHLKAMKQTWERDRSVYFAHSHHMRWMEENRHYVYPDGSHWAVPYPIAWCESGGNYYASPWGAYGLTSLRPYMNPKTQDEEAHRLFLEYGEQPWAPYEGGCLYR